jgi:3,4-dihydroxy 2-butanone 4-phosphate synthase/GTP cyclohydrolase II
VVELCKLAGLYPGGVLCELVNDNGEMMTAQELKALARRFNIPIVTVGMLAKFVRSVLKRGRA